MKIYKIIQKTKFFQSFGVAPKEKKIFFQQREKFIK